MAQINPPLPVVGQPVSTEDPKVRDALSDIVDEVNGLLDNNNIAAAANINGTKLLNASIPTGKLEDDAVTADKLRDDATTDDNRAVTTNHIRNDAVTADKLRDSAVTDLDRAVTTNHLRDISVTTDKLANAAVTTAKLGDAQVTNAKVALTASTGTFSYSSGYSALSSADYAPLSLRKAVDGRVTICGGFQRTSNFSINGLVGTVPEGFRPSGPIYFTALNGFNGSTIGMVLYAFGELRTQYTTGSAVSGASIIGSSFYAA
jgi:hypothetical protein